MWDETVWLIDGKRVVNAREDGNEMPVTCLDGQLSIVASADVRWCELDSAAVAANN